MLGRLKSADAGFDAALDELLAWEAREAGAVAQEAARIIDEVRVEGDAALLRFTATLDRVRAQSAAELEIDAGQLERGFAALSRDDRQALQVAAGRIRRYHEHEPTGGFELCDEFGNRLGQRVTPLDRVGVYIPGGQAAYPSTVLMTVLPARVAGVREVVAVTPTPDGRQNGHVLAAMHVAGVDRAFAVGGAQAVAALAYGTETVPKVDKVVGPGGAFVAAAKRLVFGPVGIDLIAGPSEILIIADGSAPPHWMALDLFSQAEHDADAQALLVSPDAAYLDRVEAEMRRLLPTLSRAELIRESLAARGAMVAVQDLAEACEIANRVAPEHLQLSLREPDAWLDSIRHAGAIFVGSWSAEVLGDYSAGPSHVLPTFGTARYASVLSVADFQKRSSIVRAHRNGMPELGRLAVKLAEAEGLTAHAAAAEVRLREHNADV